MQIKNIKDAVTNIAAAAIALGSILVLGVETGFFEKQMKNLGTMLAGSGGTIVAFCTGKTNNLKASSEGSSEDASRPVGASDAVEGE